MEVCFISKQSIFGTVINLELHLYYIVGRMLKAPKGINRVIEPLDNCLGGGAQSDQITYH